MRNIYFLICIGVFTFLSYTSASARSIKPTLHGKTSYSFALSNFVSDYTTPQSVLAHVVSFNTQPPNLVCPSNRTENTDAGVCTAFIDAANLTPSFDGSTTVLTWQMTGAVTDSSPLTGINTIPDYTFPVGTTTIAYTADDGLGNIEQCSFTVTITDSEAPTITLTGPDTVTIEACTAYTELGATATDNCSGVGSVVIDNSSVDTNSVGSYTVTYNVTDAEGNPATQVTRTVNVVDTTAPTITLNGAAVVTVEACGSYTELGATADDGCLAIGAVTVDNSSVDTNSVGSYTVTYNVTDAEGNPATQVTRTVNVVDTTAPTITLNGASVVTVEACGSYTELGATADDGCLAIGAVTVDNSSVDTNSVGSYTVTYNVTDAEGNPATQVTRTVNVVDTTAPTITLNGASVVTVEACGSYTELGATADDGCLAIGAVTVDNSSVDTNSVGSYTVTYNVTDAEGNPATQVTRTVNVVDTTAPTITLNGAAVVTVEACGSYTELGATADDGCLAIGAVTVDNSSVDTNSVGSYTVTYNITDAEGNPATQVTRTVNVVDTTAPTITLNGASVVTVEACGSYTELGATADDGCLAIGAVTVDNSSVDTNSVGSYTVTYNVTDAEGNPATQVTRTVNVVDTTAPNAVCQNITVQLDASGNASITAADINNGSNDNCGVASVSINQTDFDCSDVGNNTVTLTVTDVNGNTATCNATVTVEDNVAPNAVCQNITVQLDASGNASITAADINNGSNDNCGVASVSINQTDFDCGDVGNNTVTLTVTDVNGNTATCNATVTVEDNVAPNAVCQNITVQLDASGNASITAADINNGSNDNCGVASVSINQTDFDCSDVGNNTVTLTVTDVNGNSSTCNATVTVEDNVAPSITCPGNQNVSFTGSCQYTLLNYTGLASANDNCSVANISQNPVAGTVITAATTVTLTATDTSGNTTNCSFQVIPSDNTPPNAVCQNLTVQLDPGGSVTINAIDIDNGSNDNCGIQSMNISPSTFDCSAIGNNNVTLTVTDTSGNTTTCTATVTVEDITPPNAVCGNITVTLDASTGEYTLSAAEINSLYTGTGDICSSVSLGLAQTTFGCEDIGANTVALTIADASGNTSVCNATVTIEAPEITSGTLTGEIVNPVPDNPEPPSELIEVTACPGGVAVPKDVQLTLNLDGSSNITAANVLTWQISTDEGLSWNNVSGTAGLTQHTLTGLLNTTLVRIVFQSGDCQSISPLAIIRFLPPDEPPIIVNTSNLAICLNESVDIEAMSYFEYASQIGEGGFFNYAQPEDWRVDGIDGFFPASGNNADEPTWKETNGPKILSGIRYDTHDNTKFAAANGPYYTTLETPVFNTIGMSPGEAVLQFYQAYYFCNGGEGRIELSLDGGNTYDIVLNTDQGDNLTSGNNSGFTVTSISNCNTSNNGQHPHTDPLQFTSIDLSDYIGMSGLRIRFVFDALGTTRCNHQYFPPNPENTCNNIPSSYNVYSSWVIDDVGFPYAPIDEILEWTDENGTVIAIGENVTVTPVTPGIIDYGVTSLVNGCRADGDAGTQFVPIEVSLAYAGQNFSPQAGECGQSSIRLNAYDNTLTAVENYNNGAYESNLYVVPNLSNGDTNYPGTGMGGSWSIVSAPPGTCGTGSTFSSTTNPRATFTGDPGTYRLRWTLQNGCYDEVDVTITSCDFIDFDGNNDYVTFRDNYNLTNNFSIEAWVKPHSVSGTKTVFSKKIASSSNAGYDLSIVNGQVRFNWYSGSGNGSIRSQHNINASRWYHLAVTFDGGTYKLYVDGIDVGTVSGTSVAPATTSGFAECILGAMDVTVGPANSTTNHFHGWIDEVRIWNVGLTVDQIRLMMNQEIYNNTAVRGEVIPIDVPGLNWSNLDGYYRMNLGCGSLAPYKGVGGRLINIFSSQQETAPLPYTSRVDGQNWATDNTWTHFNVWDAPNSLGIDGTTPIDWNIVQISHNINSGNKDITVLGLISDTAGKELTMSDPGSAQDESNLGQSLRVTHYLKLDGIIDLVGESQLLQDQNSILDVTSSGYLERDQQGTANLFNYNYWSSPVSAVNTTANNTAYSISSVLRDGTNTNNPMNISWTGAYNATGATNPISISRRWLYAFYNGASNTYSEWDYIAENGTLATGLGFTMKGSGIGNPVSDVQNYVFIGKPHNGTLSNLISSGNEILIGNPYPSAIDADEFILDNIPGGNAGTTSSFDGSLYFWVHYTSNATHVLSEYEGGYAVRNLTGGIAPVTPPITNDGYEVSGNGSSSLVPTQYIPVGQGFFVGALAAPGGQVTFHNDQRIFKTETLASESVFARNNTAQASTNSTGSDKKTLRLTATINEAASRYLLLGFIPNSTASDGFDFGYDAENYDTFPNDVTFNIAGKPYVIQGVGEFSEAAMYPLSVYLTAQSTISLSLESMENFEEDVNVYIYDAVLNTYAQINDESYEFTLEPGNYLDRYFVTFNASNSLSTTDIEAQQIAINFLNNTNEIFIKTPSSVVVKRVSLISILGQSLSSWDETNINLNNNEIKIPVKNIAEGNYIVKIETSTGKILAKKIIINQ